MVFDLTRNFENNTNDNVLSTAVYLETNLTLMQYNKNKLKNIIKAYFNGLS